MRSALGIVGCVLLALGAGACRANDTATSTGEVALQIENGDFESGTDWWWTGGELPPTVSIVEGRLCAEVPARTEGTPQPWDTIIGQDPLDLVPGEHYTFRFTASAGGAGPNGVVARSLVQLGVDPYTPFAEINAALGEEPVTFEQTFIAPEEAPLSLQFQIGGSSEPWTFCVDDVDVAPPQQELIQNGDFSSDTSDPWWTSGGLSIDTSTGEACATVPAGGDPWSVLFGQNAIPLRADATYALSFRARGNSTANVVANVQMADSPYTGYFQMAVQPPPEGEVYTATFTSEVDLDNGGIQFQLGGAEEAWDFCVDDVSFVSDAPPEYYTPDTGPRVRINQHGYPAGAAKHGTLVTDAEEPLEFVVEDADGNSVLTGTTEPRGLDPSSDLNVHVFDLSALNTPGEGYTVVADEERSHPFAVAADLYEPLRLDSLDFYYTQRSGIEIDGAIAGEAYGRPAGHVSVAGGDDLNQGDVDVPCQPADDSLEIYGEPWTCDYTLDVTGGWYDAGDHGKYVVNGGISVYQLLNAFERTKWAATTDLGALGDSTLAVPERGNGVPDVLDEARWELEFFLKMVVPEGDPLAGMVHHKVHDNEWTGLPLLPDQDDKVRWLHRPSTAATLNLVATAAQGARLFAPYDAEFSARLLAAAKRSWTAALEHPALFAPSSDGASGGGPYQDDHVSDEFYWAAAELFLTTGEDEYLASVLESPHHTEPVFDAGGISWYSTAALGRLDLATVPSALPDRERVRDSVLEGADLYLDHQAANLFGQPYLPDGGGYVWGSNSQILNNIVVLGAAYDISGSNCYRRGALEGLDYILGRNALNISYVTDYGTVFANNQHSRMYANQLDPTLPHPPSGSVSGGPNSHPDEWDPTALRLFGDQGCAPQFCYVDDITSWSTNEITINWNSALAWAAAFAADQDAAEGSQLAACEVEFRTMGKRVRGLTDRITDRTGHFVGMVKLKNTGERTIRDWTLSWSFFGDQSIRADLGADLSQEGALVTATPKALTRRIRPGRSAVFAFLGNRGTLANPEPVTFFLNGQACTTKCAAR